MNMFRYNPDVLNDSLVRIYQEAYEFEVQRKDALGNKQSFALAVVTLIVGVAVTLLGQLPSVANSWRPAILLFLMLTYISLGISLLLLWKAAAHRTYSYLSNTANLDAVIQDLHRMNEQKPGTVDISYELTNYLANHYRDAASVNRENNRIRTGYFTRTFVALYVTLLFVYLLIGIVALSRIRQNDIPSATSKQPSEIQSINAKGE